MQGDVRERPIPFSAPLIPAVLDGRKTQTRRLVKVPAGCAGDPRPESHGWWTSNLPGIGFRSFRCPYGQPGDLLWVREAWRAGRGYDGAKPSDIAPIARIHYESDGPAPEWAGRLRPPMFMPRWVSRITLLVTGVRVERAREIGEEDIAAEGISPEAVGNLWCGAKGKRRLEAGAVQEPRWCRVPPRDLWQIAWTLINGRESWKANPWVWVVEFERVGSNP